ncbi:MAG: hypothetical protein AB2A00_16545 [Myxococcota bacterium]
MIGARIRSGMTLVVALLVASCSERSLVVEHVGLLPGTDAFGLVRSVVASLDSEPLAESVGAYQPRLKQLEGQRVVIRGGGSFHGNLCSTLLNTDVNALGRDAFFRLGILEAPQVVDLQYDVLPDENHPQGVVVAADHDSLAMLTTYVNLDHISAFFHDVLGDRSPATETRATVAFYGELGLGCQPLPGVLPVPTLPVETADGASYVPTADTFVLLRDAFTSYGVELVNNPGVQAHELAHRVFIQNLLAEDSAFRFYVLRRLGTEEQRNATCTDPTPDDEVAECDATDLLLRGMDEGFADILAYAYTGRSDFLMHHSFPAPPLGSSTEAAQRDLAGTPSDPTDLERYGPNTVRDAQKSRLRPHRLGTLLARAFFQGITRDDGTPPASDEERVALVRRRHAPALIRAVRVLGRDMGGEYRFDARQLVRRYVEEVVGEGETQHVVRDAVCRPLCDRFGDLPFPFPVGEAAPQCAHVPRANGPCQL